MPANVIELRELYFQSLRSNTLQFLSADFIISKLKTEAAFSQDGFILNHKSWVRIGLAFLRDWLHLELLLENCLA